MKSSKLAVLSIAVLSALGLAQAAAAGGRPDLVNASLAAGKPHMAGELLVQFKPGASAAQRTAVMKGLGASRLETIRGAKGSIELVRLPAGLAVAAAVRAISTDAAVDFAEPNWTYQHTATANDTYYTNGSMWGMYGDATTPANQYGSQAGEAWAGALNHTDCSTSVGNPVYVGVIDEGIFIAHPELSANIWSNQFDPVDGVDNDGNGYVDDKNGWDFDGNTNNVNAGGAGDDHGTHVSGTIAAQGGNGVGVAGVCWSGIKLISGRFLGRRGGTTANAIKAVQYFTDLKTRHGLNIVATNNSWGGGGFSQALSDAIDAGGAANIVFVAAAGNSNLDNDVSPHYPSSYAGASIISVASLASNGTRSSFSQWGANSVDIGAPGSGIMSTVPVSSKGKVVAGYASYSGTSMATPHVTGAVALWASRNPGATASQTINAIYTAGTATPSMSGITTTGKRLNASGF
ncbi:MAG: S8 family peptidase [Arenimonas sp.]